LEQFKRNTIEDDEADSRTSHPSISNKDLDLLSGKYFKERAKEREEVMKRLKEKQPNIHKKLIY